MVVFSEGGFIDTDDDGFHIAFTGGGDDDFFSTCSDVLGGFFGFCEEAGRLDYDIDLEVFPREIAWRWSRFDAGDTVTVDDDGLIAVITYGTVKGALSGVIL